MGIGSILNVSNVTIDTYPLLTPTPIILNPIVHSEKPNFYDILIEDDKDKGGDVTVVMDNKTPKGMVNMAGNTIVDAKNDYGIEPRSLVQSPDDASRIANSITTPVNQGSRVQIPLKIIPNTRAKAWARLIQDEVLKELPMAGQSSTQG